MVASAAVPAANLRIAKLQQTLKSKGALHQTIILSACLPPELFPLQTRDLLRLRTRVLLGSPEKNTNTNAEFKTRQAFYHTINWLAWHLTNCDTGLCNFCSILSLGNILVYLLAHHPSTGKRRCWQGCLHNVMTLHRNPQKKYPA